MRSFESKDQREGRSEHTDAVTSAKYSKALTEKRPRQETEGQYPPAALRRDRSSLGGSAAPRSHTEVMSYDVCLSLSDLFTQYDNLCACPYCCKWHYSILIYDKVIFYCIQSLKNGPNEPIYKM